MATACESATRTRTAPAATATTSEHCTRPRQRLRQPQPSILAPSPSSLVIDERREEAPPTARTIQCIWAPRQRRK
eukprot:2592653-Alexandrium_andersonii.AAC.1